MEYKIILCFATREMRFELDFRKIKINVLGSAFLQICSKMSQLNV